VTERPETVECGSNLIAGSDPAAIGAAVALATKEPCGWRVPEEYHRPQVAEAVVRIVTSFRIPTPAEAQWQAGR